MGKYQRVWYALRQSVKETIQFYECNLPRTVSVPLPKILCSSALYAKPVFYLFISLFMTKYRCILNDFLKIRSYIQSLEFIHHLLSLLVDLDKAS